MENFNSSLFSKILLSLSMLSSVGLAHARCENYSVGFHESWANGICGDRWMAFRKQWGGDNNGTVPDLITLEQDVVDGMKKNVLVITTQGNLTKSNIHGVVRTENGFHVDSGSPQRVGAAIATTKYFASGSYEVKMKIGRSNDLPYKLPVGMSPSIWLSHYEEHYAGSDNPNGEQLNPLDPQYQTRFKEGSKVSGFFSTVNSEINAPELGRGGDFNTGCYNTYISEVEAGSHLQQIMYHSNVADGNYHTYRVDWHTHLVPTNLSDDQVKAQGAYYYAVDSATSPLQGFPVIKKADGKWYAHQGKSTVFYLDGHRVGKSVHKVSPVAARLVIGGWFPSWAGVPDWAEAKIYISDVTVVPYNEEGDVFFEPESFPIHGLVPPAEKTCGP